MTFCGWVLGGGKGWGSLELCCLQHLVQVTWPWHQDMNRVGWLTWKFRFCQFYSISDIWTVAKRPLTEIHQLQFCCCRQGRILSSLVSLSAGCSLKGAVHLSTSVCHSNVSGFLKLPFESIEKEWLWLQCNWDCQGNRWNFYSTVRLDGMWQRIIHFTGPW